MHGWESCGPRPVPRPELVALPRRLSPTRGQGGHRHLHPRKTIRLPAPSHGHTVLGEPGLPESPPQHQLRVEAPACGLSFPSARRGPHWPQPCPPTGLPPHRTPGTKEPAHLLEKGEWGPYCLPLQPSTHLWKRGPELLIPADPCPHFIDGQPEAEGTGLPSPRLCLKLQRLWSLQRTPWPFGGRRSASTRSGSSRGAPSGAMWRSRGAPGQGQFSDTRGRRSCLCPHHRAWTGGREGPCSSASGGCAVSVPAQPSHGRASRGGGGWVGSRGSLECWLAPWKLPGSRASFLTAQLGPI